MSRASYPKKYNFLVLSIFFLIKARIRISGIMSHKLRSFLIKWANKFSVPTNTSWDLPPVLSPLLKLKWLFLPTPRGGGSEFFMRGTPPCHLPIHASAPPNTQLFYLMTKRNNPQTFPLNFLYVIIPFWNSENILVLMYNVLVFILQR